MRTPNIRSGAFRGNYLSPKLPEYRLPVTQVRGIAGEVSGGFPFHAGHLCYLCEDTHPALCLPRSKYGQKSPYAQRPNFSLYSVPPL